MNDRGLVHRKRSENTQQAVTVPVEPSRVSPVVQPDQSASPDAAALTSHDGPTQGPAPEAAASMHDFRRVPVLPASGTGSAGAGDGLGGGPPAGGDANGAGGAPLPPDLRSRFERSLGTDLSAVRVVQSPDAERDALALGAQAFTLGQHVYLGPGAAPDGSPEGQRLLAHEVAHTVQQPWKDDGLGIRGRPVASATDPMEAEAERASAAMLEGLPIQVSRSLLPAPTIQRQLVKPAPPPDLRSPAEKLLPKPIYWNNGSGDEINGKWEGGPVFPEAQGSTPLTEEGNQAQQLATAGKAQFAGDWKSAQSSYNTVAPEMEKYHSAAADAEKKGLLDLSPDSKGKDLGEQAGASTLPGADHTIDESFDKKGAVNAKYNKKALTREQRLKVDKAKKEVANKTEAVKTKVDGALNKQNDLKNAVGDLNSAVLSMDQEKEEGKKKLLEAHKDALVKSKELCGEAIKSAFGAAGGESKGEKILAGAEGAGGIINTIIWDHYIHKIEGEMQVIEGSIQAIKELQAGIAIAAAKRKIENGLRDVSAANREYNQAMRERAGAYQELATLMGEAAEKSGSTEDQASKLTTAVQAIPAMEYVVETVSRIGNLITVPVCEQKSALGAALADEGSRTAMTKHVADLEFTKKRMGDTQKTWQKRIDGVNALINKAR